MVLELALHYVYMKAIEFGETYKYMPLTILFIVKVMVLYWPKAFDILKSTQDKDLKFGYVIDHTMSDQHIELYID